MPYEVKPGEWSPEFLTAFKEELWPHTLALGQLIDPILAPALVLPEHVLADIKRIAHATNELQQSVEEIPRLPVSDDVTRQQRRLRHGLLNTLNRVAGYAHLLAESQAEATENGWHTSLGQILVVATECEKVVLRFLVRPASAVEKPSVVEDGEALACRITPVTPGSILVVDDDPETRAVLRRTLQSLGHAVTEGEDGHQAIHHLRNNAFDLVLLDIRMPGGPDGFEVLSFLRSDPRRHLTPVMMISGINEVHETVRCIQAGAEDFLAKPIDHVLLRARVNALLHRRQLRIEELEQFFPPKVARQLVAQPDLLRAGSEATISVLFCDVRGYSRMSRRLGPAATSEWIASVMDQLSDCILRNSGVVVDFIGDELMGMWGAPTVLPDHAIHAVQTAIEMFQCLPKLNEQWSSSLGNDMMFGIGINSGPAWVGNTGTRRRFKFGPNGDTVNVASRVQGATKYLRAPLMVSRATHELLEGRFQSRRLGRVRVVNIADPVEVYEVPVNSGSSWEGSKVSYEQALELFEAQQLEHAARKLGELIATEGASGPPLALLARTVAGIMEPERWTEVFDLPGK